MSYCSVILAASWMALRRLTPSSHFQRGQKAFLSATARACEERQGSAQKRGLEATTGRLLPRLAGQVYSICSRDLGTIVTAQVSPQCGCWGPLDISEPRPSAQWEVPCGHLSSVLTPGVRAVTSPPPGCRQFSVILGPSF